MNFTRCSHLKVLFTNWHMIAHMKQNFIQTSDMLLFASVSFWLNRNKGKYGKKIRPIGYKFMRLWLQKLTQVTTITYTLKSYEPSGSVRYTELHLVIWRDTSPFLSVRVVMEWEILKVYIVQCFIVKGNCSFFQKNSLLQ